MKKLNIKKILVPTDFSETGLLALEHGAFMARIYNAELFILHVIESLVPAYGIYDPVPMVRFEDEAEDGYQESLNMLSDKLKKNYDIKIVTLIERGSVEESIAAVAKGNGIDIILMGTHGAKGMEEYILGSNAQKTATVSPCPVITFKHKMPSIGFTKIVLPIDDTQHSRQKVDQVIELAKKYKATVHLLGLISLKEEVDEKKFAIKLDAVEKALKHSDIDYVRCTVKGDNIATEAMEYSSKIGADLIVIMADHESTVEGVLLGMLTKQIINHSQIPVMSIRPVEGKYDSASLAGNSNPYIN